MYIYAFIGPSAVGKTRFGKKLAEQLRFNFIDVDRRIEDYYFITTKNSEEKLSLSKIIEKIGEDAFKELEEKVILNLTPDSNSIIATGGSVIYSAVSIKKLKSISQIIYLTDSTTHIISRIKDYKSRGIIGLREGMTLEDLINERHSLYLAAADIIVNKENKTEDQVLAELKEIVICKRQVA